MIKGRKRTVDASTNDNEEIKKIKFTKPLVKNTKNETDGKSKGGVGNEMKAKFAGAGGKNKLKSKGVPQKDGKSKFGGKKFEKKENGTAKTSEKTDWKKFKQDKKELKIKRKQSRDSYEIAIEAKQLYEKLKCRRTLKKDELVEKLFNLINTGDVIKKLIMAHDTARIIQCMLKYATPSVHEELSKKLLPLVVEMAMSKYSHFCVLRMFKYGSNAIKSQIVDSFMGSIVKLTCHTISSKILDHVYLTIANSKQKIHMRQEFYGELYRKAKDDNVKQLPDTYKDAANLKASILSAVKANLEHVANKNLLDNSLVHSVLLEYLHVCDDDKLEEVTTTFGAHIPLLLTTKEGCQASIFCFYKSTTKNRRAIIKVIKEHLVKICTHEHGHTFIIVVLNCLDDTKAIKKAIYDHIHPELQTLMSNQWGRRVIEWLIAPADTNCFHPSFSATIDEGLQYGKKDKELRRKEIFEQIEEPIAKSIESQPEFWISNRHIGLATAEILKRINATNFTIAANALSKVITQPNWSIAEEVKGEELKTKKVHDVEKIIAEATELKKKNLKKLKTDGSDESDSNDSNDEENKIQEEKPESSTVPGIEDAGLHIVLKKIIKNDKERLALNPEAETFGTILAQHITDETLKYWLTVNRACFVLLNILENNTTNDSVIATLKNLIVPHLELLKQQKASGAQLLLKKIT